MFITSRIKNFMANSPEKIAKTKIVFMARYIHRIVLAMLNMLSQIF